MTQTLDQPVRLIAMDLDGTLVHSTGGISPRNRAALDAARAAGVELAICTGRRHSYALRVLRTLPLQPEEVVISSNGAVTRTAAGDLLWRVTLPLEIARRLCTELQEYRNALVLTFDMFEPDGHDAPGALVLEELDHLHGSIRSWMEVNAGSIRRISPLEQAFAAPDSLEPIQAMLCGDMKRIHRAEALLHEYLGDDVDSYRTEYPGKDLCILDILHKGRSKGSALLQLAERRGIPPESILAIGDNWNDEPMLRVAGQSVVMRNAPEDFWRHASEQGWQLSPAEGDEDGVALAIEEALERIAS